MKKKKERNPIRKKTEKQRAGVLSAIVVVLAVIFFFIRIPLFLQQADLWSDWVLSLLLFGATAFFLLHGAGYLARLIRLRKTRSLETSTLPLSDGPAVAVCVVSYHEPLDMLKTTLGCMNCLFYANRQLYLLDDTRYDQLPTDEAVIYRRDLESLCEQMKVHLFRHEWHDAKVGLLNDFIAWRSGHPPAGCSLISSGDAPPAEHEKYLAIFDANQNPMPDFINPLIGMLESDNRLGFVQTPEYYTNVDRSSVARAAELQQETFFEFVCEGKSRDGAMCSCGTNVIFRMDALIDIGGFQTDSMTEDLDTSLLFLLKGWRSRYDENVSVFGTGPEQLAAYFKQQFQRAQGSLRVLRRMPALFGGASNVLTLYQRREYFLSATYYLFGVAVLLMSAFPVLFIFTQRPAYLADPQLYLMFFVPYLVISQVVFYSALGARHYRFDDLFYRQVLRFGAASVYVKATAAALFGMSVPFYRVPRGKVHLPWEQLWPQMLGAALNLAAVIWGLLHCYYLPHLRGALVLSIIWCMYHFLMFHGVHWFNRGAAEDHPGRKVGKSSRQKGVLGS